MWTLRTPARQLLLWLVISCAASLATAQDQAVEPGQITVQPGTKFEWIVDYSVQTQRGLECPQEGPPLALHPLQAEPQWGCKAITNTGETTGIWRVDFGVTSGEGVRLFLVQDGTERIILTAPKGRTMGMTEGNGPWLASLPFAITPGETVVLWTELSPYTTLRVSPFLSWAHLVPEATFNDSITHRSFAIAALLSASALLILFLVTFARLLGSAPARDYAIYFICATAAFVTGDAYLAWAFPSVPVQWSMLPAKPLEIAVFILYYRFVASFVRTALGEHGVVRSYRAMAWTALGIFFVSFILAVGGGTFLMLPEETVDLLAGGAPSPGLQRFAEWAAFSSLNALWLVVGLVSAAYALWAIVALLKARADGAVLFALGGGLIIVLYFLPYLQGFSRLDRLQSFWVTRGMIVADGLVFAAALVQQTFGLRAQRDAALRSELAASQEKLALTESLLTAKEGRAQAEAMAERHRERLALTSHDLRQPLTSLQLAVADAEKAAPGLGDKLASGIGYLKQVLDETVVEARPEQAQSANRLPSDFEPTPVALLLKNVDRMFADEARAKGLEFEAAPSDLVVATQPVALIRILSNLVSNAVKYTQAGSVHVSAIQAAGKVSLTVADTGPGLAPGEIEVILQAYKRGEATDEEGEGIGLSSVLKLADELGLTLKIDSVKGEGSQFSITGLSEALEGAGDDATQTS